MIKKIVLRLPMRVKEAAAREKESLHESQSEGRKSDAAIEKVKKRTSTHSGKKNKGMPFPRNGGGFKKSRGLIETELKNVDGASTFHGKSMKNANKHQKTQLTQGGKCYYLFLRTERESTKKKKTNRNKKERTREESNKRGLIMARKE